MTTRAIDWTDRLDGLSGADAFTLALLLKATVLVLLGAAVVLLLSRAPAAARHLGWALTVVGLLALPAVAAWAPAFDLPVLPEAAEPPGVAEATGAAGTAEPAAAAAPARGGEDGLRPSAVRGTGSAAAEPVREAGLSGAAVARGLYLVWGLGTALCLLYLAAGLARVTRLGSRADRVDGAPGWRDRIGSLSAAMGVGRPVSVRISDRVAVPLAYGLRRPVILLPAEARGWDDEQRRDVLLHELAHVTRGDWPVQLAARLACALYWFHPLVWWSARHLALEAERACDDRVLLAGADSCDYAERLLRVASGGRQLPDPSYAAVAMARRSDLATRVRSILDGRVRRHGLRALPAALVAAALLVPLAAVSTARLAQAEAPTAEPSPEPGPEPRARPAGRIVGSSPLIVAAFRGDLDEVRRLLDAGADPNLVVTARDRSSGIQRSALGSAARAGHLEVADLLLDRGAEVDLVPRGDASALITAARHGHRRLVGLLLARGADPNRVVEGDGSALIAAARNGDREIVRMLLDAGADPDTWVDGDENPLYHAVNRGDAEVVGTLLEAGADPNREMPGDGNALIEAARSGDLPAVRQLLAAGADPNRAVRGDGDPLIAASAGGHLDIVRVLVEAGADLDRIVPGDENPLIQAAGAGRLEVVRYLLDAGADPNVRVVIPPSRWRAEADVRTPLSMARRGGHDDVVRLLRNRGARE